ncbi:endonuclease/exonuclease/phosphatase family protein [Chitinophaga sedimenti]|nr:endonuclease/exonuclease/phosphatase family protein [Chitinophaga sedimenti]MCK7557501.1 endonuclease/exonuclease/phosphatase family protein [Chitinophaga sedimenti]
MHYYYGRAIPYEGGAYGVGILSKYPLKETRTFVLPKVAGFTGEDRVVAMARVQLPGGKSAWFASTHLDVTKEENRKLQSDAILKLGSDLDAPLLIGGDFNATDDKAGMQSLFTFSRMPARKKARPSRTSTRNDGSTISFSLKPAALSWCRSRYSLNMPTVPITLAIKL